jgi:hypothetical protein
MKDQHVISAVGELGPTIFSVAFHQNKQSFRLSWAPMLIMISKFLEQSVNVALHEVLISRGKSPFL